MRWLLVLLLSAGAAWAQPANVNPPAGSVWQNYGPTLGSGWGPIWNTGAASTLPDRAAVIAAKYDDYPKGVFRNDYAAGVGAPPLFYSRQTGTCASHALVNDGALCIDNTEGNSFIASPPASGMDARQWGWKADHATDNTAVFNNILAGTAALFFNSTLGAVTPIVWFPPGQALFNSKPDPITRPVSFHCASRATCALIRNYTPVDATEPFLDIRYGYINWSDFDIAAGDGTSGGYAIKLEQSPSSFASWSIFSRIRILYDIVGNFTLHGTGSSGLWARCWQLIGDNSPVGLRDVSIDLAVCGNATDRNIYASAVHQFVWTKSLRTNASDAPSPITTDLVEITAPDAGANISQNVILAPWADGQLLASNITRLQVSGIWATAGTIASSVENCLFEPVAPTLSTWTVDADCNGFLGTGAWKQVNATVTCLTGSLTSYAAKTFYRKVNKTVQFTSKIDITTNGTCADHQNLALPVAAAATADQYYSFSGINQQTQEALTGFMPQNTTQVQIYKYDSTYSGADGQSLVISGTYQSP